MRKGKALQKELNRIKIPFGLTLSDLEYFLAKNGVVRYYDGLYYDRKTIWHSLFYEKEDQRFLVYVNKYIAFVKRRKLEHDLKAFKKKSKAYHQKRKLEKKISFNN